MDASTAWSVAGIIVSVVLGIYGIYIALRVRYPGRITMVIEKTIELYDDIGAVKFPGHFFLTFNGEAVKRNLVLLNGALVNTGKTDIGPEMVE